MSIQTEDDVATLIRVLVATPRGSYVSGRELCAKTGLVPERLRDAVTGLVDSHFVELCQGEPSMRLRDDVLELRLRVSYESPALVLLVSGGQRYCMGCGHLMNLEGDVAVEIHSATAGQKLSTTAGSGQLDVCTLCGERLNRLQQTIPIYTKDLKCPSCQRQGELTVRVQKRETAREDFELEAVLECSSCNRKSAVRRVIGKIVSVASIEVGLGGVIVKGHPTRSDLATE